MTNNPSKLRALSRGGIKVVGRMPLHGPINADNRRYLAAKATRAGHKLDHVLGGLSEPDSYSFCREVQHRANNLLAVVPRAAAKQKPRILSGAFDGLMRVRAGQAFRAV